MVNFGPKEEILDEGVSNTPLRSAERVEWEWRVSTGFPNYFGEEEPPEEMHPWRREAFKNIAQRMYEGHAELVDHFIDENLWNLREPIDNIEVMGLLDDFREQAERQGLAVPADV